MIVMAPEGPRYAIYFTPEPAGPLSRFGSCVIGYDANSGVELPLLVPDGYNEASWAAATAEPRRYGFHATLKAPFHLQAGTTEADIFAATSMLAKMHSALTLGILAVRALGSFIALMIEGDTATVRALAAAVVSEIEPLRAPLSPADYDRRRAAPLTQRQVRYLDQYGYPYVFEDFRFHMTLTGSLMHEMRTSVREQLAQEFAVRVPQGPIALDALSILRQDTRDSRFQIIARFPLKGHLLNREGST